MKSGETDLTATHPMNALEQNVEKMHLLPSTAGVDSVCICFPFPSVWIHVWTFLGSLSLPLSWLDSYANISVHYANVAANRHANVNISTCQWWERLQTMTHLLAVSDFLFFRPVLLQFPHLFLHSSIQLLLQIQANFSYHDPKFTPKHLTSHALNILEATCLLKTLQKRLIFSVLTDTFRLNRPDEAN